MAPVLRKRNAKAIIDSDSESDRPRKRKAVRARHAGNPNPRAAAPSDERKTTEKKTRRVKKGLQNMLEMPLDVLYEILAYLNPADLVHLRKVNGIFHTFLSGPSAGRCWTTARANWEADNAELPNRPDDMTEIDFMVYLFGKYCHKCSKSLGTVSVCWEVRRRYCAACRKDITAKFDEYYVATTDDIVSGKFGTVEYTDSILCLNLRDVLPIICIDLLPPKEDSLVRCNYAYTAEALQEFEKEVRSLKTRSQVIKYVTQRRNELTSRYESEIYDIHEWFNSQKEARAKVLQRIRETRFQNIVSRLEASGWAEEIRLLGSEAMARFKALPVMKLSKPMTDRAWKNCQPTLVEWLEAVKALRIEEQRKRVVLSRVNSYLVALPKMQLYKPGVPSPFDIALGIPMVREIIEQPVEVKVGEQSFEPIRPLLPSFVAQWQQDVKAYLSDLVKSSIDLPSDTDPLSLAVGTYFKCDHCSTWYFVHQAASWHECCHRFLSGEDSDPIKKALVAAYARGRVWLSRGFTTIVPHVQRIAALFGMDPARVTAKQMDESPLRLACKICDGESYHPGTVTVFGWRRACLLHHHTKNDGLYIVSNAIAMAAKTCEPAAQSHLKSKPNFQWRDTHCTRCPPDSSMSVRLNSVIEHVKTMHNIPEPVVNEDYTYSAYLQTAEIETEHIAVTLFPRTLPASRRLYYSQETSLQEGRALVYNFEKDCVADSKMPVYV